MKKKIGELLFQIIPVMIGVYLGFVVTNWSDGNQRKKQSQVLIDNMLSEIKSNKDKVFNVRDYHMILRDSCKSYSKRNIPFNSPGFFKGIRTQNLSSSSYETGIQTGLINEIPISKLEIINQLYTLQNEYNDFGKLVLNRLITMDMDSEERGLKGFSLFSLSYND